MDSKTRNERKMTSSPVIQSSSPSEESWRSRILREFTPGLARLTLVADPDGLLLEEGILEGLRERGFDVIIFSDPVEFRYTYESRYRSKWDQGIDTGFVVIVTNSPSLDALPFDLLQAGRKLSFSLGDIFPKLSYSVVKALGQEYWDALYEAQKEWATDRLSDNDTRNFILRYVFEIKLERIKQPLDLLRELLRRHYQGQRIPEILGEWFLEKLRQNPAFNEWPLETIMPDREAFFEFLQKEWATFIDHLVAEKQRVTCEVQEDVPKDGVYNPQLVPPATQCFPFECPDIQGYIYKMFVEGMLRPVPHQDASVLSDSWVCIGVQTISLEVRLDKILQTLEASIPNVDSEHTDWFHLARGWSEMILLANTQPEAIPESANKRIQKLQAKVDAVFTDWVFRRYKELFNLPSVHPVMGHHIPRFIANQIESHDSKVALVVVDGLAFDQWLVVKEILTSRHKNLRFREQAVFAWIPSTTPVSRQAMFAGKVPLFFPDSINSTDKEPTLWKQFWMDRGFSPDNIVYIKGLGCDDLGRVFETLSYPRVKVAGFVVNTVDDIMHGMKLGTAGMHNQVRQWAPYMSKLLDLLFNLGFHVYLASDHGNIEATGCGRPIERSTADVRGERVRIYSNEALRHEVKKHFPDAIEWEPIGLPDGYFALLAPARQAFVSKGERIVTHGGISIEELIVPFVQIERTNE